MKHESTMSELSDLLTVVTDTPPMLFEHFTNLNEAPLVEPWTSMKKLAESPLISVKCMGLIANGAITNQKKTFLFSKKILIDYISKYTNNERREMSGTNYAKILAQLTSEKYGFMKCLSQPSVGHSNKHRAGTYEIIYEPVLRYINK